MKKKAGSKKARKKRDTVRYPGLVKGVNSKVKQEYMDQDYIEQLTDKEKEFLSNFNEEFYGGNFQHKGKKFHKKVQEKRDCYNRNNARNRCMFGIAKASAKLDGIENYLAELAEKQADEDFEERLIELIDGVDILEPEE